MSDALIDTNILVYAYAENAPAAHRLAAQAEIERLARERRAAIAVQNLAEFSSVCLKKSRPAPSCAEVAARVDRLRVLLRLVLPSDSTVGMALNAVDRHRLAFWDAMLWAVAKENGVAEIVTEDFQDGREVEGVMYRNPFGSGPPASAGAQT